MGAEPDIAARAEAIRAELRARLGVSGRDLEQALRRAGRLLPRRVRARIAEIVAAQKLAGNPRLERRLDHRRLEQAHRDVSAHLEAIDRADLRRGRLLGLAGQAAFHLIVVAGVFVYWLWWRGYV